MASNLTSSQIKNWQSKLNKSIKTDLVKLIQDTGTPAAQLAKITKSDDPTLSQRYTDLNKLTTQAAKQLTTFMNSFNTALNTYINTIEAATQTVDKDSKTNIDNFAERPTTISKLKM